MEAAKLMGKLDSITLSKSNNFSITKFVIKF